MTRIYIHSNSDFHQKHKINNIRWLRRHIHILIVLLVVLLAVVAALELFHKPGQQHHDFAHDIVKERLQR